MTTIQTANRLFKLGSLTLTDPDPSLPPDQAVRLYSANYPQIANAELVGPVVNDQGDLVYTVERSPVKTKG